MAEALLRRRHGNRVKVASAGSHPKSALHPNTVRVLREEFGIEPGRQQPQSLAAVTGSFDYVITLCDKIRAIQRDHGSAVTMHWSLPDPSAAAATDAASYPEFQRVARELESRINFLTL
jgi:protein-tyrosine-phosphatase